MRRMLSGLGVMLLAGGLTAVAGISPANAACPGQDGTVPGTGAKVITVGTKGNTKYTTIYVDDRDFADHDSDGDGGSLWLYIEDNESEGLQRGGNNVAFTFVNPNVPRVDPIFVLPAGGGAGLPVPPKDVILFPNGVGGGSLAEAAGAHDECKTDESGAIWTGKPDSILF